MADKRICITTDCACDLTSDMLKTYNIDLMYFYITTETGRFRDVDEITSRNIFEYLQDERKRTTTKAPPTEEFREFFERKLEKYDEVIHITISSKISMSMKNSTQAVEQMGEAGKRIHIFDSRHLSSGLGLIVLKGAQMLVKGHSSQEIIEELTKLREMVSTTFMANNADYLYINNKVSKNVKLICSVFNIHPVLKMQDGYLKLKSIQIGNYEKSAIRYIKKELKNAEKIDKEKLFITHSGCSVNDIKLIKKEVEKYINFENVWVTKASATISGNSGPRTFGVLFARK